MEFACFIFHVGLLFYQLFVFQTEHRKWREFWCCIKQTWQVWHCSVKKTKFWSKICININVTMLG